MPDPQYFGYASWYGPGFHGKKTASGEIYDQNGMSAAHRTLPFGTTVQVTNTQTKQTVTVRINDRGPFVKGRVIDVSQAAADELGLLKNGTAPVEIAVLGRTDASERYYVQVGSFRDPDNASRMLGDLQRRVPGRSAAVVRQDDLSRVWVGPVEAESDAVNLVEQLERAGYSAFVLRR